MSAQTAKMLVDGHGFVIPQQHYDPTSDSYVLGNAGYVITETQIPITASSQQIIGQNSNRKFLAWMVVGTADVTISAINPVVSGVGIVYKSSGTGKQGASEEFPDGAPSNAFYAIAAATGSTLIVWEGQ